MNNNVKPLVEIYTDGSCAGNPGVGGWGALLISQGIKKEISGYVEDTTNNQMELTAAIQALQVLKKSCKVNLYTDSNYVRKGITQWIHTWNKNDWRKKNNTIVKNIMLWQTLQQLVKTHDIVWIWVQGHANNEGNNIADKLAVSARKQLERKK